MNTPLTLLAMGFVIACISLPEIISAISKALNERRGLGVSIAQAKAVEAAEKAKAAESAVRLEELMASERAKDRG